MVNFFFLHIALADHSIALNTYNGAGEHVLHETTEEGLGGEVSVVLLEELTSGLGSQKRRSQLSATHNNR
jgi:hypothetical protein